MLHVEVNYVEPGGIIVWPFLFLGLIISESSKLVVLTTLIPPRRGGYSFSIKLANQPTSFRPHAVVQIMLLGQKDWGFY